MLINIEYYDKKLPKYKSNIFYEIIYCLVKESKLLLDYKNLIC